MEKLDACAAPRKQVHELEWELKKRADEIRELQKVSLRDSWFLACFAKIEKNLQAKTILGWHDLFVEHKPRACVALSLDAFC